jgi:hypothetical protein
MAFTAETFRYWLITNKVVNRLDLYCFISWYNSNTTGKSCLKRIKPFFWCCTSQWYGFLLLRAFRDGAALLRQSVSSNKPLIFTYSADNGTKEKRSFLTSCCPHHRCDKVSRSHHTLNHDMSNHKLNVPELHLKAGHDRFLSHHLQFIIPT